MSSSGSGTSSQPSSILFYIAIAVGVLIAFVFIFFSLRYYVRTKLGIYATARLTTGGPGGGNIILLNTDFPIQQLNIYNRDLQNHFRAQRRQRRYLKKRRLTEQEVDHLFPVRTYQNWLDGGAERDIENRDIMAQLKQEDDEVINEQLLEEAAADANEQVPTAAGTAAVTSSPTHANHHESTTTTSTLTTDSGINNEHNHSNHEGQHRTDDSSQTTSTASLTPEVDLGTPFTQELHYDSGTCAICIDVFEQDDMVRGLICGHVFHQECLDPWLTKRKACCPMCKRDYYLKNTENGQTEVGAAPVFDDQNDADSIGGWPELHYTTLDDRVAEILQNHPELETIARDKVNQYMSFKWRMFWLAMGISKADLLNCTIASEDERRRENGYYDQQAAATGSGNNNNDSIQDTTAEATGNIPLEDVDLSSPFSIHSSRASQETRRETVERLA